MFRLLVPRWIEQPDPGGVAKDEVLKAFRAHIFFDDQEVHLSLAATSVPSAHVPYKTGTTQERAEA
jgi:hypothetical protein